MKPDSENSLVTTRLTRPSIEKSVGRLMIIGMNTFLPLFAITAIFPLLWMIYNSLKTSSEFALSILALPQQATLQNYLDIFGSVPCASLVIQHLRNRRANFDSTFFDFHTNKTFVPSSLTKFVSRA